MVERLRQHPDWANRDFLAFGSLHHHWFFRHPIDREDGDLRRIDNWSSQKRAKATGVREGVGPFGEVVRIQQARSSLLDQRVDGARELRPALLVRVLDNGNDQTLRT